MDTNIVSFMLRNDSRMKLYDRHIDSHELAVSFMTIGELYAGATLAEWGKRLWDRLDSLLADMVDLQSDDDLCRQYASVRAQRKKQPIAQDDAWIAATALRFGLELVTHNPKDFHGIRGLRVISEVEAK